MQYNYVIAFIALFLIGLVTIFLINKKVGEFSINKEIISFRTLAILPAILFTPTLILAVVMPESDIGTILGMLFHMAAIIIVGRMPAPNWSKAAGFSWLALDIACGAMTLCNVPADIAFPVRLGGHVLGAMWIIPVSLLDKHRSIKVLGVIVGLWLSLYTFFGNVLPIMFIAPPGVFVIIWFTLLAWKYKTTPILQD